VSSDCGGDEVDARITKIEPTMLMLIDIIVAQYTGVLKSIRENNNENNVLDDEITVTADIDVSSKLQLNRITLIRELRSITGAILM